MNFGFEPYTGSDKFVFISYKSEEYQIAAEYAQVLNYNGINVYYDAALRAGDEWERVLLETIVKPNCAGVVMMMSNRANSSVHIRDEIRTAHRAGKPVLAVYIENVPSIDITMRNYLENIQDIKLWQIVDKRERYQKVFDGVRNMMAGTSSAVHTNSDADRMFSNAKTYINSFLASSNSGDLEKAQECYKAMTETYASDYRGWMGLIECICIDKMSITTMNGNVDSQIATINKYFGYVRSSGAGEAMQSELLRLKSILFSNYLNNVEQYRLMPICNNLNSKSIDEWCKQGNITEFIWRAAKGDQCCDYVRYLMELSGQLATYGNELQNRCYTLTYNLLMYCMQYIQMIISQLGNYITSAINRSDALSEVRVKIANSLNELVIKFGNNQVMQQYNQLLNYVINSCDAIKPLVEAERIQAEEEEKRNLEKSRKAVKKWKKESKSFDRMYRREERRGVFFKKVLPAFLTVILDIACILVVLVGGGLYINGDFAAELAGKLPPFIVNHPWLCILVAVPVISVVLDCLAVPLTRGWTVVSQALMTIVDVFLLILSGGNACNSCYSCATGYPSWSVACASPEFETMSGEFWGSFGVSAWLLLLIVTHMGVSITIKEERLD